MRKVLLVALLISVIRCMTIREQVMSYAEGIKRKTKGLYEKVGGISGIKDTVTKHIQPIGSKIKNHSKHIAEKVNDFGRNKAIPHAKKVYANIKQKIAKGKPEEEHPAEEVKRKEESIIEEIPAEKTPEEEGHENEKPNMEDLEKFLKEFMKTMKFGNAEHENFTDDYNADFDLDKESDPEAAKDLISDVSIPSQAEDLKKDL
ncbi:hypothetical protein NEIRO03_0245 [Nematocida sp. AWRm78]|nr:hypothetical protein NEIRO02_0246 [Nematocida sp. AWRm79]KAI5182581.1 hypothetical protein NEIRO03_0245 [Nematocida sp. AWRm78]